MLHKPKDPGSPLAPAVGIPGASFAAAHRPRAGGRRRPRAARRRRRRPGLPGGALPGFGGGLRGSALGCANAEALHFTAAEKARCAEQFGEGARESPQMSAIDASKRQELDHEAASAAAAQKYRDSTPPARRRGRCRPAAGLANRRRIAGAGPRAASGGVEYRRRRRYLSAPGAVPLECRRRQPKFSRLQAQAGLNETR